MNFKFVDAVCDLIDCVLIEHCCIPMGDEAILNETATVNSTLAVLKEIQATPELSSRHQWADKRLRAHADDYNDPNEVLETLTQVHQWVERQLKARRDDDD
jgi:hypothetical protein